MIGQLQTMVFALKGHDFGIPTNQVLGVEKINNIVPVPSVLNGVMGLTRFQDKRIPVIDLSLHVKNQSSNISGESDIVIVNKEKVPIGLLIDKVIGKLNIPLLNIKAYQLDGINPNYLTNVAKVLEKNIVLLDLDYMFKEIDPNDQLEHMLKENRMMK